MTFNMVKVELFIILRVLSTVFGKICSSSKECNMCGVCIDKNPLETECYYPYPEIVQINGICHFRLNICEGYNCENEGKCQIEFGFSGPVCKCSYDNYFSGLHCDTEWGKDNRNSWVQGIAVLIDQFREKSESVQQYSLHVYAAVYSEATNLQFYVETSEGYVIYVKNPAECSTAQNKLIYPYHPSCEECWAKLPKCKIVYKAKVQFPYKLSSGQGMLTRSGNVIGYMANITVVGKTVNEGVYREVYRKVHPIMVNYENLQPDEREHMPVIYLQNCGKTLEERIFYLRRSTISLTAQVKDTPRTPVLVIWDMWPVEKLKSNSIFQINKGFSWILEPFKLRTTTYVVELHVSVILGPKTVANFATCYIEVVKSRIKAIISGGSKITVNKKQRTVIISGAKSFNPNKETKNQDLQFSWSCSPQCNSLIREGAYGEIFIPSDLMVSGKTYNFSLKVSNYGYDDEFAFQEVYVSDNEMSVHCLMNCLEKVIPFDPLLLEVRLPHNAQIQREFTWTKADESGTNVSADDVKCKNHYPSYLLCVEQNTLKYGGIYNFQAKMANSDAVASKQVHVGQRPNISCVLDPLKGIRLRTSFSISCTTLSDSSESWVFEFFDKLDSDSLTDLSGRMIATNSLGVLRDFKITRGTICVYLFDTSGMLSQWHQSVELTLSNATKEDTDDLFNEIERMVDSHEMKLALKKSSLVSDLIVQGSDKTYIAEKIVNLIRKIPFEDQGLSKLGLITIKNCIISLTKDRDYKINSGMLKSLIQVIHASTHWTEYVMDLSDNAVPAVSQRMLEEMATASMEAIEVVLQNRNESFLDTRLEDVEPSEYEAALEASILTEAVISRIGRALSFRQGTGYTKTSVSSTTNLSLITAQSDYLQIIVNKTNENTDFPLKISDTLTKWLSFVDELSIHLTTIRYNPFWVCTNKRDIATNLVGLDLYNKHSLNFEMTRLDYINNEIDLFLEVLHSEVGVISVAVLQLDPTSKSMEDMDKQLTVLRVNLESRGKLMFSFSFQNSSDEIKIYVSEKIRPDYELVNTSRTIISSSNASYEKSSSDSDIFVYIGILPGPNVPINGSVNVTVHFHYHLCLTWLRRNWVSDYCTVGPTTNNSIIHCRCTHLSFFGAMFLVPPNEIDPFNDIELFLTLKDNWFVVAFMACLLIAFVLLGVWAKINDKKDRVRRTVLILEDNFPGDKNCYLLAVFTGCRLNAGTNANVGVQIHGSESSSHSHILKTSKRKVLQRNSEDWFMIQTSSPLGVVSQIHVWHDNSGVSPDWYCNKMVVYDLGTSIVYTFFVEQWLALENREFCEAVLLPATSEDMDDVKRIVLDNMKFGFRDADMSGSILARHPRSRIDRLDRVVILMCFIVIALLVSLAFYEIPFNADDSTGVDNFGFSFESQDILISFQTFVISSALLLFVSVSFSKAYKPEHEQRRHGDASIVYTRPSHINPLVKTLTKETPPSMFSKNLDESSYYHRLVRRIRTALYPLPLSPVALSKTSAQVKTNRFLYIVAWLGSVLLISCCVFLIILYGLKLGQEESKQWLTSNFLVLLQEFVIMSPLKIVIISILLATTFERFVQISRYSVTIEDVLKIGQVKNESYYTSLLTARSHPMYQPLNGKQNDLLREKRKAQESWRNLLDLMILIAYISIICVVTYDYSIQAQSYANLHVAQMVLFTHSSKHVDFHDVNNMTLYYDYLRNTLVDALYNTKWYNNGTLKPPQLEARRRSMWWTMDKMAKLVGPPSCRQIRVDPKKCLLNQITKNGSVECIPNWTPDVEETDDYNQGWKVATTFEFLDKKSSAWNYVLPSQSGRPSRQGESWTTYHGGGYMVRFSSDRFETEDKIQILTESKWINQFTRAVFLDFTIFNVNENIFTEVVLIAEHFPFGLYVTRAIINSVHLDMIYSVWKVGFVLFILIILFHVVKMFRAMNRKGFIKYFLEFVNIYQVFVTGLGVLSVVFFLVNLKISLDYTKMFQKRGADMFFEFDKIVYYSIISVNTLIVLFCFLSFRLFSLWPFGGSFLNIYHALLLCGETVIARFLLLFLVYILVFCRLFSYLLNCMLSFPAFYWHWSKSVYTFSSTVDLMVLFLLSFSVKLCLGCILMVFCYQYKLGQKNKVNPSDFAVLFKWLTRQR